ncbi:hypothetical protein [Dyadobacter sandarakinus]|uniref:Uncharacterized protein n=1 Tax=Dyadobacter sandarakinus TaxID=2747268 RepID=A0ABX7I7P6_9BACT|nr:hypothetical protein [Dyadobacter sandarakinus]QRR01949.1 hypothetical protein HWI92_14040 [Dyadobacter sandarakinus]
MPQYRGTEGELIPVREARHLTRRYQRRKEEYLRAGDNYVEAEFFGLETFRRLLDECGGEPVGFRVYYSITEEDHEGDEPVFTEDGTGRPTPRLVIVPVDAEGVELTGRMSIGGLKDMPDGGGNVMAKGPICPRHC